MDLRELEIFLAVAELRHFGRASQACNLSPSALTRTIQRMEEELEQPLFLRDNRTVTLSPAGERLKSYARLCLSEWQSLRSSVKNEQAVAGSLSIYASITAVYGLLPELLESYREKYPEVQLELRTGAAEQAVSQVQSGEIDLAVAAFPDGARANIQFLPIVTIPLIFIAPRRSGAAEVPVEGERLDLSRAPLVLPQTGLSRRRLDQWLKEHRITPNITSEVSGNEAIIAMVRLGCGVGIVPQLVLERSPFRDEVVVLDNAPVLKPYEVGLCTSKRNLQRPSVKAFWQLAEEHNLTGMKGIKGMKGKR
ncbi:HTH-type transcriptional activator IlvY [Geomonas nitrogeniifigens]|uniref:HTH-type transcriptional activator IlvY n=1 Tax=Geomonas diazotrophica TaxID=2843197 RepID=A0ABX8JP51_9BACT|nr:HTH-type transcriptional activator IlvY [Geomonas nitrogeniifigens]QWV98876.1 HTH-type transcriptional activator IlvY [Geomonas nitrogeniifigens]